MTSLYVHAEATLRWLAPLGGTAITGSTMILLLKQRAPPIRHTLTFLVSLWEKNRADGANRKDQKEVLQKGGLTE